MEGHYPAIDVLQSISRLMPDIVDAKHRELASKFVETMAVYKKVEDMINLGAYKEGANPKVDYALGMIDRLRSYLKQGMKEKRDFAESLQGLRSLFEQAEGKA
jgi:flagellum-specific ATP synthase